MQEEIRRKNAQERRAAQLSSGGNKLPAEAALLLAASQR